ncbi:MAG: hypothetical protein ACR2ND_11720 [Solirubrobacteraceae bacterium]
MSSLKLRHAIRSSRRSVALMAVLTAITAAVAVHHAMPMAMHEMDGTTVCLAIMAVGAAAAVASLACFPCVFPRFASETRLRSLVDNSPRSVPARAGPIGFQVLRL